jgi:hypothetical protein
MTSIRYQTVPQGREWDAVWQEVGRERHRIRRSFIASHTKVGQRRRAPVAYLHEVLYGTREVAAIRRYLVNGELPLAGTPAADMHRIPICPYASTGRSSGKSGCTTTSNHDDAREAGADEFHRVTSRGESSASFSSGLQERQPAPFPSPARPAPGLGAHGPGARNGCRVPWSRVQRATASSGYGMCAACSPPGAATGTVPGDVATL